MKILTNCPQELGPLNTSPRQVAVKDLPADQRAAWKALSPDSTLALSEMPGPVPALLVIDKAPRSQFEALLDTLKTGAKFPRGLAALALEGHNFKGQRERSWSAVRGNLHLCVYYPIHTDASRLGMGLTVLPAIATVSAIRQVSAAEISPGIKWVNDVLVDGQKVAGVLTATQTRRTRIEQVVFGIGLNVKSAPDLTPTPFVPAAGYLGHGLSWQQVLGPLLNEIDRRYHELITRGPAGLIDAYRSDAIVLNRRVRIWPEGTTDLIATPPCVDGTVTAIDDDLAIHIEGVPEPIRSGRLALEPVS